MATSGEQKSKKILIVTDKVFTRRMRGDNERIFHMYRHLAEVAGIVVYYTGIGRAGFPAEMKVYHPWNRSSSRLFKYLARLQKLFSPFYWRRLFRRHLFREIHPPKMLGAFFQYLDLCLYQRYLATNNFDIIIYDNIHHSELAAAVNGRSGDADSIIDIHDIMSVREQSLNVLGHSNWVKLKLEEEIEILRRFDLVLSIQRDETSFLKSYLGSKVITYGVNLPNNVGSLIGDRKPVLVFVGVNSVQNQISVENIYQKIWPHVCNLYELHFVGEICHYVKKWDLKNIFLHNEVSDLSRIYRKAGFLLNPTLVKGGLKIKNLEALSYGCSVITSPYGAEGLAVFSEGGGLFVCHTNEQYVEVLKSRLKSGVESTEIALAFEKYLNEDVNRDELFSKNN